MAKHVTAEHLGNEATELDVTTFNACIDYLTEAQEQGVDDDYDVEDWLWNDGDFLQMLDMICEEINQPGSRIVPTVAQGEAAKVWLAQI